MNWLLSNVNDRLKEAAHETCLAESVLPVCVEKKRHLLSMVIVASLLGVVGVVYLPLRLDMPLCMGMTYLSIFCLFCIGR